MLTAERRRAILGRLEQDGKVVSSELVVALGVSEDTVRRDLHSLAVEGLLQRVHGGALPPAVAHAMRPFFTAASRSPMRRRSPSPKRRSHCSRVRR